MINKQLNNIFITFIVIIIRTYQIVLSPIFKTNCRYLPTCSEYSITAFKEHGFFKGFYFSLKRIANCHPFGGKGYDPVPKKINKEV